MPPRTHQQTNKPANQQTKRRARSLLQQCPPASTRKKASMSASVPISPSLLKSASLSQGGLGQVPAMQAKKASISASVPMSPSQLKSALPQGGRGGQPQRAKRVAGMPTDVKTPPAKRAARPSSNTPRVVIWLLAS